VSEEEARCFLRAGVVAICVESEGNWGRDDVESYPNFEKKNSAGTSRVRGSTVPLNCALPQTELEDLPPRNSPP